MTQATRLWTAEEQWELEQRRSPEQRWTPEDRRTPGMWLAVCAYSRLPVERGVAALFDRDQVALFRLADGSVHAVQNLDPFSGSMVMSRGIVGCRGGRPVVTSPMYKQAFDLETGACLDDPQVALAVHQVLVRDGVVHLWSGAPRRSA